MVSDVVKNSPFHELLSYSADDDEVAQDQATEQACDIGYGNGSAVSAGYRVCLEGGGNGDAESEHAYRCGREHIGRKQQFACGGRGGIGEGVEYEQGKE